jgi:hypothetical protein
MGTLSYSEKDRKAIILGVKHIIECFGIDMEELYEWRTGPDEEDGEAWRLKYEW